MNKSRLVEPFTSYNYRVGERKIQRNALSFIIRYRYAIVQISRKGASFNNNIFEVLPKNVTSLHSLICIFIHK